MNIQKTINKLNDNLQSLRREYGKALDELWIGDSRPQMVIAGAYLVKAETRLPRATKLLEDGATKQATKILRKTKEFARAARCFMKRALQLEEEYKLKIVEDIHLS
jgi:hypothetical protein